VQRHDLLLTRIFVGLNISIKNVPALWASLLTPPRPGRQAGIRMRLIIEHRRCGTAALDFQSVMKPL